MTKPPAFKASTYQEALREHLAGPSNATLSRAYELGQAALDAGTEIFDVIRLHHEALAHGVITAPASSALGSFLLEALAPFRAAGGGPGGAWERRLGRQADQDEDFALRNARLEEEIADQQRAEDVIRESKDHYFQLYQEARAMHANLRELSAQVLSAQEDERKRISRELHDEVGQALIAINVTISKLKTQVVSDPAFQRNVADAEQLLAHTMDRVHSFARELRPAMLDHLGLQSALRAHILAFTRQTGIRTVLVPHPNLSRLDSKREEVLFRVVQEALNNVYKHAAATSARVEFTSTGDAIDMEIGDNGCAFSVDEKLGGKGTGRLGLLGMQERVRHVNGSFAIESVLGSGTRIHVKIPLDAHHLRRTRAVENGDGRAAAPAAESPYPCLYEEDICAAR